MKEMKREKNGGNVRKESKNIKKSYDFTHAVNFLYFIIVVLLILLLGVALCAVILKSLNVGVPIAINGNDTVFSIILTGLAIFFASSIILPRYLLNSEVKNHIADMLPQQIEKEYKNLSEPDIKNIKNETKRTDAHLSRMIALFLMKEDRSVYTVWAIGWCFRSLKRYFALDPGKGGAEEYEDFLYLIKAILKRGLAEFSGRLFEGFPAEFKDTTPEYKILFIKNLSERLKKESMDDKDHDYRTAFRAFKDIFDFEFNYYLSADSNNMLTPILKDISKEVGIFAQIIFIPYMEQQKDELRQKYGTNKIDIKELRESAMKHIRQELLNISEYGHNRCTDAKTTVNFCNAFDVFYNRIEDEKKQQTLIEKFASVYKQMDESKKECILSESEIKEIFNR